MSMLATCVSALYLDTQRQFQNITYATIARIFLLMSDPVYAFTVIPSPRALE